jgi:hypothetical protein
VEFVGVGLLLAVLHVSGDPPRFDLLCFSPDASPAPDLRRTGSIRFLSDPLRSLSTVNVVHSILIVFGFLDSTQRIV